MPCFGERCSCDESVYLRMALARIAAICGSETDQMHIDDLAEIANIVGHTVEGKELPPPWTTTDERKETLEEEIKEAFPAPEAT